MANPAHDVICYSLYMSLQVGLSGVLLYAQPSLLRVLRRDSQISKFVKEGDLLVVDWDLFHLRHAKEAQRRMLVGAAKGGKKRGLGSRRPFDANVSGPRQVWDPDRCGMILSLPFQNSVLLAYYMPHSCRTSRLVILMTMLPTVTSPTTSSSTTMQQCCSSEGLSH